ncbi:hypothetical protein [Cellulomonas citrea]|uniref:hypothetical protein n=1 Tax=Cellulomonas citrea TaxID=1909423 RepID=UPI00135A0D32|nr:hypothetical protein [Cellulomonas citrea]
MPDEPVTDLARLSPHDREVVRDAVTMALYVSLSLLAVLIATPPPVEDETALELAAVILLTGVGLLLAHQVAFILSSRLLSAGRLDAHARRALSAQLAGGMSVAVLAALPVLALGGEAGLVTAELLLLALVAVVGYLAARSLPMPVGRSLMYVGGTVLLAAAVIIVKLLAGH